ncbi:MAG: 50S ribosomal protein L30 [Thermoflexales bacterium]|nr:50S ribosomal protein L30 [Thermoflexales bacterium]
MPKPKSQLDPELAARVRITLVKSPIGYAEGQKRTVRTLGLHRMNQTVEQPDSASLRGMIAKVSHLVSVELVEASDETA